MGRAVGYRQRCGFLKRHILGYFDQLALVDRDELAQTAVAVFAQDAALRKAWKQHNTFANPIGGDTFPNSFNDA